MENNTCDFCTGVISHFSTKKIFASTEPTTFVFIISTILESRGGGSVKAAVFASVLAALAATAWPRNAQAARAREVKARTRDAGVEARGNELDREIKVFIRYVIFVLWNVELVCIKGFRIRLELRARDKSGWRSWRWYRRLCANRCGSRRVRGQPSPNSWSGDWCWLRGSNL